MLNVNEERIALDAIAGEEEWVKATVRWVNREPVWSDATECRALYLASTICAHFDLALYKNFDLCLRFCKVAIFHTSGAAAANRFLEEAEREMREFAEAAYKERNRLEE